MEQKKRGIARRATTAAAKGWAYSLGIAGLYQEGLKIGNGLIAAGQIVRQKLTDGPQNHRHETFDEAVERLGLDEEHLIHQARVFSIRSWSWFASSMLAVAWLLGISFSDAPFSHALLCLGLILMSFTKQMTWRFRFCQIRDQELYAFWPWLFSPGRW